MASRRHHHDHCSRHQNNYVHIPQVVTSPHCCTQFNHPLPPPAEDNLLHLVASYIQNQQQETKCQNQTCSCETSSQSFNLLRTQNRVLRNVPRPREHDDVVLSCLLRKVDDLESSLNKFSSFYNQRRDRYSTLKDSAARVIQTHFRSYLVRRSISFRQLKELAMIKSSFLSLKSSVSGKPIFPFQAISRKATDLLRQLDSIQGRIDPMIRSSKISLSRDLVRFLQSVDNCVVKRYEFVGKSAVNVSFNGKRAQGFGVGEHRTIEKLRNKMGKVFVTSSEDEDDNAELEDMTDDSEEVLINSNDKRKIGSSKSRTGAFVKGNAVKSSPVRKSMGLDKNRKVYHTHDLTSSAEDDSVDGEEETLVMSRDDGRKRQSSKTRNVVLVKGNGGGKTNRVVKTVSFDENGNVCKVYGDTTESSISEEDDSMSSGSNDGHGEEKGVVLVKGSGEKTTRVVKTVRFDENGNVYKVYGDTPESSSISEEDDLSSGSNDGNGEEKRNGNEVKEVKYVPKENKAFEEEEEGEEEEEETHSENGVSSSEGSEGDIIVTRNANQHPGSNEHKKEIQHQKGNLMFSPPMPLKMEP